MAYCPRCGKEQRCGCDRCHECGAELTDRLSALPAPVTPPAPRWAAPPPAAPARQAGPPTRVETRGPTSLQAVLLALGTGLMLITIIEVMKTISVLPNAGAASSFAEMLKRAGYYIGTLLYTNSARSLTGVAFVTAGLLMNRPWPFHDEERWRSAGLAVGWTMWAVAALCIADVVLLMVPASAQSSLVGNLLPPLWVAISVILVMGAALLVAGWFFLGSVAGLPFSGAGRKAAPADGRATADAGGQSERGAQR